jgi:hypothetical protein
MLGSSHLVPLGRYYESRADLLPSWLRVDRFESVRRRFARCYRAFQDGCRTAGSRVRQRPADKPVVIMAEYPPRAMIRAPWHKPSTADPADAWPRGTDASTPSRSASDAPRIRREVATRPQGRT